MALDWSWHALQVAPGREFRAVSYLTDDLTLEAQGLMREDLHVLLPVRHVVRRPPSRAVRRARAAKLVALPRIPGYLLLGFQPQASPVWPVILALPHVLGRLGPGERGGIGDQQLVLALLSDLIAMARRRRRHKLRPIEISNGPYQSAIVGVIEVAGGDPEVYGVDAPGKSL